MHMPEIQSVLKEKSISFSYVEEDNCGSIDFEHRGLRYHIWEYAIVGVFTKKDRKEGILMFSIRINSERKCVLCPLYCSLKLKK